LIRFSIYGHVHKEQFGIARSYTTGKPIGVQHWTGSVSTFVQINPSFRVFEVDAETMLPVKIHTYIMDIKEENPHWKWDHELTEYYNMPDLSPESFDDLATRMLNDEALAMIYHNTMDQNGGETYIDSCDYKCRQHIYCQQRNSAVTDTK
jgi:sphingomyelin phosphodiesterase